MVQLRLMTGYGLHDTFGDGADSYCQGRLDEGMLFVSRFHVSLFKF